MECQKEIEINQLHELLYLTASHSLFSFESVLPTTAPVVLVEGLGRFSQEVGFRFSMEIFHPPPQVTCL